MATLTSHLRTDVSASCLGQASIYNISQFNIQHTQHLTEHHGAMDLFDFKAAAAVKRERLVRAQREADQAIEAATARKRKLAEEQQIVDMLEECDRDQTSVDTKTAECAKILEQYEKSKEQCEKSKEQYDKSKAELDRKSAELNEKKEVSLPYSSYRPLLTTSRMKGSTSARHPAYYRCPGGYFRHAACV